MSSLVTQSNTPPPTVWDYFPLKHIYNIYAWIWGMILSCFRGAEGNLGQLVKPEQQIPLALPTALVTLMTLNGDLPQQVLEKGDQFLTVCIIRGDNPNERLKIACSRPLPPQKCCDIAAPYFSDSQLLVEQFTLSYIKGSAEILGSKGLRERVETGVHINISSFRHSAQCDPTDLQKTMKNLFDKHVKTPCMLDAALMDKLFDDGQLIKDETLPRLTHEDGVQA